MAQDFLEARKWYQKAADQGDAYSDLALGNLLVKGSGGRHDFVQAYMWFDLVANGTVDSAADDKANAVASRTSVAAKMNASQIAEAQLLEQKWLASHPKK